MDYSTIETSARVREWQYLTGRDIDRLDRQRTVLMLSCSPLEVHGPHLPVVTDLHEAEGLALRAMELLCEEHPEVEFVHLPPLWVAADVLPHPGSVMFRSSTITRVLADLGRSLARQGFRHLWVASFHGGPRHFVPIEIAADRVYRRWGLGMVSAFSLLLSRLTGGGTDLAHVLGGLPGLTPEELDGDTHGGAIETSLMLHLLGRHVASGYEALPRLTVDLELERLGVRPLENRGLWQLVRGFRHKLAYFAANTYSGKPSLGDAELGRRILDVLARETATALSEVYTGRLRPEDCHSPLWKARWLFSNETLGWAFERMLRYESRVF
ncbi:MAG: creatininase family protein [Polyangiaceae bacterium]|nr:creatininase family protein [Polyangiaceae bacterium]